MKLGVSTWSLLGMDVYSAVKLVGDSGVEYVELWGEVPHAYPGWVDGRRLKDSLSAYDMTVTVHAPFTDLNPASPFQPVRGAVEKAMEEFVEFSASLGAVMITVHPGSVHNEALVSQSAGTSVALLRKMVKAADGRLSVNVENMSASHSKYYYPLGSSLESLERLLNETDGAKCTIDTGHANVGGLDPWVMAGRIGDRLAEIHVSDNGGSSDEHLIPGRGTVPFDGLKRTVQSDVLLCLELNPHVYTPGEVLDSVKEAKSFLKLFP